VFRPNSPEQSQTVRLRGLDPQAVYKLSFEDGSNPAVTIAGEQLLKNGFRMSLGAAWTSELVWIERK
jgi:hypothetical protein